jgi:hypothetical protein
MYVTARDTTTEYKILVEDGQFITYSNYLLNVQENDSI